MGAQSPTLGLDPGTSETHMVPTERRPLLLTLNQFRLEPSRRIARIEDQLIRSNMEFTISVIGGWSQLKLDVGSHIFQRFPADEQRLSNKCHQDLAAMVVPD